MSRLSGADWVHLCGVKETYPFALLIYAARGRGSDGVAEARGWSENDRHRVAAA